MARGFDSSQDPGRKVDSSTIRGFDKKDEGRKPRTVSSPAIRAEAATQRQYFGTVLGPMDDGMRTLDRPAPVVGAFEGARPETIMLAQMKVNREHAMAHLMQPPPHNDRKVEGLVDTGMGRLSAGPERPVHRYIDERIKLNRQARNG